MTPPNPYSLANEALKFDVEPVRCYDNNLAGLEVIEHHLPEGLEPAEYAALLAQTSARAH